jgi:hypothetical protein
METEAPGAPVVPSKRSRTAFWNELDEDDAAAVIPSTCLQQRSPPRRLQSADEFESVAVEREEGSDESLTMLDPDEPKTLLKPSRASEYRYLGGQWNLDSLVAAVAWPLGADHTMGHRRFCAGIFDDWLLVCDHPTEAWRQRPIQTIEAQTCQERCPTF